MRPPILDVQEKLADVTMVVHVQMSETTRWRLRIGAVLIHLAGWILGFKSTYVSIR